MFRSMSLTLNPLSIGLRARKHPCRLSLLLSSFSHTGLPPYYGGGIFTPVMVDLSNSARAQLLSSIESESEWCKEKRWGGSLVDALSR